MKEQAINTAQVAFGEHLRQLRISKSITKRNTFATMIDMEPSLLKKIEDGNFKFDMSIDWMWKVIVALQLNHTEMHNFMLAGNRSPMRDLKQELLVRRNVKFDDVWIFSGHILYNDDIISQVASDLRSGISYSIFAPESSANLTSSRVSELVTPEQCWHIRPFEILSNQYLSEFMVYLHRGKTVVVVDLIRDGDSVSFMTNTGNSQMFRRRDILEDCVLNQSR